MDVVDARTLMPAEMHRVCQDKLSGMPAGARCGAIVPSLQTSTVRASVADMGIPCISGSGIVVSAVCPPAIASRGLPAVSNACPNTYAWTANKGTVSFSPAECLQLEAARHCPDHPLFVTTSHGLVHVDHGNPLTRAGVATVPTFLLENMHTLERTKSLKSAEELNKAYAVHRKNVSRCIAQAIDTCIANGASGIFVNEIGCDAGDHNKGIVEEYHDIVSECLAAKGQTGTPRAHQLQFCILK